MVYTSLYQEEINYKLVCLKSAYPTKSHTEIKTDSDSLKL